MNKLLVLSGKGGTGKTTISTALIKLSKTKYIADCDVDAPNLHLLIKQETNPKSNDFSGGEIAIVDETLCTNCLSCVNECRFHAIKFLHHKISIQPFACEGCGLCSYICPHDAIRLEQIITGEKKLYMDDQVFSTATLKMGYGNSGKLVSEVKRALLTHRSNDEWVIMDGSPGIGCPVIASINGMDKILIVSEPSLSGFSDLKRLLKSLSHFNGEVYVVINKWDIHQEISEMIEDYCIKKKVIFAGKVPYDERVSQMMNQGLSIIETNGLINESIINIYQMIFHHQK